MWGRGREGAMVLPLLSAGFQSLSLLPTIKLGPSGADSWVGGLVHALGPCGSLQRPLLWGWEFLLLPPQPPRVFSIRGLRLHFPALEPWVAWSTLLPCHSSWFIYARMWGTFKTGSPPLCSYYCCHLTFSFTKPKFLKLTFHKVLFIIFPQKWLRFLSNSRALILFRL